MPDRYAFSSTAGLLPANTENGAVAYVLKGFPRISELFIASEIYRIEQAGVRLKLFVIKPADESKHHPIVDHILARPEYLPATLSKPTLIGWLAANGSRFLPSLGNTLRRRPIGVVRAAAAAFLQAVRARSRFRSKPKKVYLREFFMAVALADRLLKAPDIRHLHAHFCHGSTTVTWLAAMITGLPFSFTAHAKDLYSTSLNPAGLLRRKLDAATFAVTCTDANRIYLEQQGSRTPIYCLYHGLNADFTRLLADFGLGTRVSCNPKSKIQNPKSMRLLGVGRLVPKKGFDIFVEACAILDKCGIAFEALIVGENGEHQAEIRRLITLHGLDDRVRLAGPMGQAELFAEYRRSSAFCLPCRVLDDGDRDGIPNVIAEAMACGVPVVTTNISGIPELVTDEVSGLLVPPGDAVAVANALVRLHRDPPFARCLGAAGVTTIRERFDGDQLVKPLVSLFQHAIHGPGTSVVAGVGSLAQ